MEREISLSTGKACAKALRKAGYDVKEVNVTRNLESLAKDLNPKPDVVFNALHGKGGEDGCIQGVLDMIGVPYTHSGQLASALAMNKQKAKETVQKAGVKVPEGKIYQINEVFEDKIDIEPPYVIKPNDEGSSVGVYIVRPGDNRLPFVREEWSYGDTCLVEEYIPGRELSVAVMDKEGEEPEALTVTEILPLNGFYNYEAKYDEGGSDHIVPANINEEVFNEACRYAVVAHKALGCAGVTRTDFRLDEEKFGAAGLYYLETNTQPGMTQTSLVPEQAGHKGISFQELVSWMVENAKCYA